LGGQKKQRIRFARIWQEILSGPGRIGFQTAL
jgi:hypothetical protein